MRLDARLVRQLLVTVVIAIVVSFAIPVFVDRHDYASAVVDATKNPNREKLVALDAERTRNQQIALETHLTAATMLFLLLNAGYLLVKRFK